MAITRQWLAHVAAERWHKVPSRRGVSTPPAANVTYTPQRASADLAFGGSGNADITNSGPARSASKGDFHRHAGRLMKRRG
jgi:hypothetical protein